jgi:hypothetical protein
MNIANDIVPTRESLASLQKIMISLLTDRSTYEKFIASPCSLLEDLTDLPQIYKNLITSINQEGLRTFRSIVSGTRQERFRQVFILLFAAINDENRWNEIITLFLDTVPITNGRDDSDLVSFEKFIRLNENPVLGDFAAIDCCSYAASNAPPIVDSGFVEDTIDLSTEVLLNTSAKLLKTRWPIQKLLSSGVIDISNAPKGINYNIVYLQSDDINLKIRSIPKSIGLILERRQRIEYGKLMNFKSKYFSPNILLRDGVLNLKLGD